MISFDKMHGNGNDFIVMNSIEQEFSLNKRLIKKLSDRNLGIGFDQLILVDLPKKPDSDFFIKFIMLTVVKLTYVLMASGVLQHIYLSLIHI